MLLKIPHSQDIFPKRFITLYDTLSKFLNFTFVEKMTSLTDLSISALWQRAFLMVQAQMLHWCGPTIKHCLYFNAKLDAEILRKAMEGFGCDKDTIVQVLCARSNAQVSVYLS